MNDLRKAAQALLNRWDSPLWNNGSTADAIADLRTALEQQQAEPVNNRIYECAKRLVEYADFKLGGILSADSSAKDIPSNAVSSVKARHLAALRDAVRQQSQQQAEPVQEPFEDLATELFVVAQRSPADDGFSDTIDRIESWLREHFSTPPQRKPLTRDEISDIVMQSGAYDEQLLAFARAIEAAHGIKGGT